jgi:hypothetical protein
MRRISLWGLLLFAGIASSCTSVTYTDLSIQQLHEKIAAGEIVKAGETATIVTADGKQQEVMVSGVSADSVIGKVVVPPASDEDGFDHDQGVTSTDVTIPISDILSVEKVQVTHPAGQVAVVAGFGLAYIFALMLPAMIVAAFAL